MADTVEFTGSVVLTAGRETSELGAMVAVHLDRAGGTPLPDSQLWLTAEDAQRVGDRKRVRVIFES